MKIFKETFERSRRLREANEEKAIDFTNYTVKEFAELVDEDSALISDLMKSCSSCSYTNNPFDNVVKAVEKSKLPKDKVEVVSKFIHANLFNNSPHRFYNGRGWGTTLHSNPKS